MPLFQITIDGFESFVEANSTPEAIAYAKSSFEIEHDDLKSGLQDDGSECFEITVKFLSQNRVLHQADIKLREELATSRELSRLQQVKISSLMSEWEQLKSERDSARLERDAESNQTNCSRESID